MQDFDIIDILKEDDKLIIQCQQNDKEIDFIMDYDAIHCIKHCYPGIKVEDDFVEWEEDVNDQFKGSYTRKKIRHINDFLKDNEPTGIVLKEYVLDFQDKWLKQN